MLCGGTALGCFGAGFVRALPCLPRSTVRRCAVWQAPELGSPVRRSCSSRAFPDFSTAWGTSLEVDAQSIAADLFATSIVPYSAFLYFLHRSRLAPPMALFGFYFLLVFVFGTIPAGIYAKTHYHTILANVDYLHGSAESLLTVTNLLIGVRTWPFVLPAGALLRLRSCAIVLCR